MNLRKDLKDAKNVASRISIGRVFHNFAKEELSITKNSKRLSLQSLLINVCT